MAKEIQDKSSSRPTFVELDPSKDQALAQEIQQKYNFRPMATDPLAKDTCISTSCSKAATRSSACVPQGDMSEADARTAIEGSIKRATPGFLKTVGLVTEEPKQEQPNPMMGMQPPPESARTSARSRSSSPRTSPSKRLDLKNGVVSLDIDVLVIAKPGKLDEKAQFAVDQYLMRGGAVVALAGAYNVKIGQEGINSVKQDESLSQLLAAYGVTVEDGFVMDPNNARFPMPVQERRGAFVMQRIEMMPYPFFPDVRGDGFKAGHAALAGIPGAVLTWASPVKLKEGIKAETLKADVLIESSGQVLGPQGVRRRRRAARRAQSGLRPQGRTPGQAAPGRDAGRSVLQLLRRQTLAALRRRRDGRGRRPYGSHAQGVRARRPPGGGRLGRVRRRPRRAARPADGRQHVHGDQMLVRNLVDWSMEDTDLLQSAGGCVLRTLENMDDEDEDHLGGRQHRRDPGAPRVRGRQLLDPAPPRRGHPAHAGGALMNALQKNIKVLGVVLAVGPTLLAVILWQTGGHAPGQASHPLFGVEESAITALEITGKPAADGKAAESIKLVKNGADWVIATAGNYPAKKDKVEEVVKKLAAIKVRNPVRDPGRRPQRAPRRQGHVPGKRSC